MLPAPQLQAATLFGKLVAQGLMAEAECINPLYEAARIHRPMADRSGLRCLAAWAVHDAAREWRSKRSRTEWAIRDAISPLLAARANGRVILTAAMKANAGDPFRPCEVLLMCREFAAAHKKAIRHGR